MPNDASSNLLSGEEAKSVVLAFNPNAILVEANMTASSRKEWTVRDKTSWLPLGPTSITTPERAWVYAAMKVRTK